MALRELPAWLAENQGFRRILSRLIDESVLSQFSTVNRSDDVDLISEAEIGYLLTCGTILSHSRDAFAQDAALRIAQYTLQRVGVSAARRNAAALILDALSNAASLALAEQRLLLPVDFEYQFPMRAQMEVTQRRMEHMIQIDDDVSFHANQFQRQFWDQASSFQRLSISAPTSVGKSYVLEAWIRALYGRNKRATVVYLVPTRALISEVEIDLRKKLDPGDEGRLFITSVPLPNDVIGVHGSVYVFTQERLQIFANSLGGMPHIDLLLVDEAHKIGDGYRGVLLQKVVEDVVEAHSAVQVIYASPFTSNPEVLLAGAPSDRSGALVSTSVTVNQNLIWLDQFPRQPKLWRMRILEADSAREVGHFSLLHVPTAISKRLPFVALALAGGRPGNVVYVNGAADAEKTALQLFDGLPDVDQDEDIENLIQLCQSTIHKNFQLNKTLKRGVAFHYGNMPLLVKSEVERLFSLNKIRFLVCTSTLVEGVNMSCRNIFVRGPKKGSHNKMGPDDFWNLAGRAGRWGREFQGNVICVDADDPHLWEGGEPPRGKKGVHISRTTDRVLNDIEPFMNYLAGENHLPQSEMNREFEHLFSYLAAIFVKKGTLLTSSYLKKLPEVDLVRLESAISNALASVTYPPELILRNPGISPLLMQRLLLRFQRDPEKPADRLLLADPSSNDALDSFVRAFSRISSTLSTKLGVTSKHSFVLALLVTNWLRGYSLARLITGRMSNYRERKLPFTDAAMIRGVMKDVEEIARYQAPRLLSCYNDVLGFHLEVLGRLDLREQVGDIGALLELGLSQGTQVSLMNLGLSRTAAVLLSEFINDDSLDQEGAIEWITQNSDVVEGLPILVAAEVRERLASYERRRVTRANFL